MKRALMVVLLLASPLLGQTSAPSDTAGELKFLRAQVKMLQSQVKSQADEISSLKAKLDNRDAPATGPADDGKLLYRGKVRTKAWMEKMFKYNRELAIWDGNAYDRGNLTGLDWLLLSATGHRIDEIIGIDDQTPQPGDVRMATLKVLSVVNKTEILATTGKDLTVIHIKGIDAENLTDGKAIPRKLLVYLEPYTYTSANGGKRTVQSWGCCHEPTMEEFQKALSKGFILKELNIVRLDAKSTNQMLDAEHKDWVSSFGHGDIKKGIWSGDNGAYKLTETPVP